MEIASFCEIQEVAYFLEKKNIFLLYLIQVEELVWNLVGDWQKSL